MFDREGCKKDTDRKVGAKISSGLEVRASPSLLESRAYLGAPPLSSERPGQLVSRQQLSGTLPARTGPRRPQDELSPKFLWFQRLFFTLKSVDFTCCLLGVGWEPPEVQAPLWCPCPGWPSLLGGRRGLLVARPLGRRNGSDALSVPASAPCESVPLRDLSTYDAGELANSPA